MSRWEFMRQLEELLSDISPNEREEALQYYNDYFNDAGRENEQEVIKALGTPEQVAQIVREGLEDSGSQGEFTESGFRNKASSVENEIIEKQEKDTRDADRDSQTQDSTQTSQSESSQGQYSESFGNSSATQSAQRSAQQKKEMPVWAIVLIVIGCIIASPVIFGVVISFLGTVLGVLGTVLGIVLGFGVATLLLFVVAAALAVAGFGCMLAHPLTGIGLLGGGCICGALGIVFLLVTVFLVGKGIPTICKGIAYVYHWIVDKVKGAKL